jgi:hypothetical protein
MTLDEIVAYVRLQYRELQEGDWEDDDIRRYCSLAAQQFLLKTRCGRYRDVFDVSASETNEFTLTYRLTKETEALYINSDTTVDPVVYTRLSREDWDSYLNRATADAEDGYFYYIDMRTKTLYLDTLLETGTFIIEYHPQLPYEGTTFDTLETLLDGDYIPNQYHLALVDWIIAQMYRKDRMLNEATYFTNSYQRHVNEAEEEMAIYEPISLYDQFSLQNDNPHRDAFTLQGFSGL